MQSLDINDLHKLEARAVALRIDKFFEEDHVIRYGVLLPPPVDVSALAIYETKAIQVLNEQDQKRALLLFYRSRFQIALCLQYAGLENHLLHDQKQSHSQWKNPHTQILAASIRQSSIVSARISFESLMEFVYFTENKNLIPAKKSKIRTFRKWLSSPGNKFGWLTFYLIVVYRFDRNHRTPEVHGTSYISIEALCCNEWPKQDTELDVTNLSLNIWRSILETLNDGSNLSCFYTPRDEELFRKFFEWKNVDLEILWNQHT